MNSKLSFLFVIQRIASLTNIWLQKYYLNTHHRQAQVVSLHKGFLQGFFAECISIGPAKAMLTCKACTLSSPPVSSRVPVPFPPCPMGEARQAYEVFQENPYDTVLQTHTSVH